MAVRGMFFSVVFLAAWGVVPESLWAEETVVSGHYYRMAQQQVASGESVEAITIMGPPTPPEGYERKTLSSRRFSTSSSFGKKILSVPAYRWSFGCSATSAAMIAAYYDRNGWDNMYTGQTNSGVMPMDNSSWGTWTDAQGATRYQCPLSATRNGLDGRTEAGHVDDYWVGYNQEGPDPWRSGGTEHAHGECTADYMYTNQWISDDAGFNVDGGTIFHTHSNGNLRYTCSAMEQYGGEAAYDGALGLRTFYESRGYSVSTCYAQKTDNLVDGGFSFDEYREMIDAGYPVIVNLRGHSMVGVGYNENSETVYLYDTWDYDLHEMTWGGSYSGMSMHSIVVVIPSSASVALPDLNVEPPAAEPARVIRETEYSVSVVVENRGSDTAAATALVWYRSSDSEISSGDTALLSQNVDALAAGDSETHTQTFTAQSAVGTFYLGACVSSVSGEINTGNNCSDMVRIVVTTDFPWILLSPILAVPADRK